MTLKERVKSFQTELTKKDRMDIYQKYLRPETPLCVNCEHFHRHYNDKGQAVQCGHCDYPRIKTKMPYDICDHFQRKTAADQNGKEEST